MTPLRDMMALLVVNVLTAVGSSLFLLAQT